MDMPYTFQIEMVDPYLKFFLSVYRVQVLGVRLILLAICRLSVERFVCLLSIG